MIHVHVAAATRLRAIVIAINGAPFPEGVRLGCPVMCLRRTRSPHATGRSDGC